MTPVRAKDGQIHWRELAKSLPLQITLQTISFGCPILVRRRIYQGPRSVPLPFCSEYTRLYARWNRTAPCSVSE